MAFHARLTIGSRNQDPVRRQSWMTRMLRVATVACVVVALPLTTGAAAWAAEAARFVPTASSATWDGRTVTVAFQEVGVEPGSTSTIMVEATGILETVCRQDDTVVVSTTSSATVRDVADHVADANGTITGTRVLALTVRPPTITGLNCTIRVIRTLTVLLHDVDTGATLALPITPAPSDGSAASSPPIPTPRSGKQ